MSRDFFQGSITTLLGVLGVWWFVLLCVHTQLPVHDDQAGDGVIEEKHFAHREKSPYYGWQADIPESNSCSIRECFKKEHNCPTCLDLPSQMGETPPDPGEDWVPEVTMLHEMLQEGHDAEGRPWPPSLSSEYCEVIGFSGGKERDDNKRLFDEVPIIGHAPLKKGPKVFCGVYTMESAHASNIRVIRETWGPHCDGFLAFSTASDPRIPALNIRHEGPEEYNNMWQKSRAIWKFIGDHYLNDFDYFILGGDDLFVIPANLKAYLASLEQSPEDDLFAGRRFKGYGKDNYFNSGGSGYVLSRGTLRKYATQGFQHENCSPHKHTPMEDVMIADCLRKVFQIGLTDTRDAQGRERFQPFSPGTHLTWRFPKEGAKDWYWDYSKEWGIKLGVECCAPDSVAFHYMKKPAMVRHLFSLLYGYCPGRPSPSTG